ncbi:Proton-dependent oligopeptide transporter family [Cinara cedri]|uniref:Proton-dependent oligopeptide transporter family n=1 Tax=Cinara cedri TaxID=506608 RepID=A0A5E4NN83_9HEMI|nr:Proton-dependent oligopeptide transporter family [Cinara cedri]
MTLHSIILVSIGMGGIKSCIAAFGVDQLIESDRNISSTHVRVFFSTFYFSIHLGVFFGLIASPVITKIMLYERHDLNVYAIRFGFSALMMTIAVSIFVCGYPYYLFKEPIPNILPEMIKCIFLAIWKKYTSCQKKTKHKHLFEYAENSFPCYIINDTKKTLYILFIYIPLSMFWSLPDQQNTTWIFQASRTSDRLFGIECSVYMLQMVNPLLILLTIPLMDHIIYPYLKKHKLFKYPLKRMLLGGSIAAMAFIFAGCIEMYLEICRKLKISKIIEGKRKKHQYKSNIWTSNLNLKKSNKKGFFVVDSITASKSIHEKSIEMSIKNENSTQVKNNKELIKNSIFLLVVSTKYNDSYKGDNLYPLFNSTTVLVPESLYTTSEENHSSIYIIFPANDIGNWLRIKNLVLESTFSNKIFIFKKTHRVFQLQKTYYEILRNTPGLNVLNLETDEVYVYRSVYNNITNYKLQSNTTPQARVLRKEWLLPQFICMAFGETLFTMTGLAFSFSEAPETMKTVSISMWYFSVALGNLTVICINKMILFEKKSHMFFMFAFNATIALLFTYKLSNVFEKIYDHKKSDSEMTLNVQNVDLGDAIFLNDDIPK